MSNAPSSLEAAFREAGDDGGMMGAAVTAEQLDLLRDEKGKLPHNVFRLVREGASRGPGRPAGSRNKRSTDIARAYQERFGDPLMRIGELANRPFDQLIETILIADSTAEREERLLGLIDRAEEMIAGVMNFIKSGLTDRDGFDRAMALIDKIEPLLERVFDAAKSLKMKPGDLAIKALNLQLAAHKIALEYVHSKKPVEAVVTHRSDGVIVAPPVAPGTSVEDKSAIVKLAADGVVKMLEDGRIDPRRLGEYTFRDGQFVDAEFEDVDEGEV